MAYLCFLAILVSFSQAALIDEVRDFLHCLQEQNITHPVVAYDGSFFVSTTLGHADGSPDMTSDVLWCYTRKRYNFTLADEENALTIHPNLDWVMPIVEHAAEISSALQPITRLVPENKTLKNVKRYTQYYDAYPSEDYSCAGYDWKITESGACPSFMSSYYSIKFGNSDGYFYLRASFWPHHNCDKGNYKAVTLEPSTISTCQRRTTYSWRGYYFRPTGCISNAVRMC